jgi:hypothetical protein
MYVEQRLYRAHPGRLAAWLKLYEEVGNPVSARHMGPLLGFFTIEVGPLNSVLFLRGYDDPDDRERAMAAREADPEWQHFRAESGKLAALAAQENKLLKTAAFSPTQSAAAPFVRTLGGTGMVIDHRTYDLYPGKGTPWIGNYGQTALGIQRRLLGQFLFFGVTECGPINQAVFMWAYESLADRDRRRVAMAADPEWQAFMRQTNEYLPLKQQTTMLLKPTGFSPMR